MKKLEVKRPPEGGVMVKAENAPGIYIELTEGSSPPFPEGALYRIRAYVPDEKTGWITEILNGDIYTVYVGKNGLILDEPARMRAAKLYAKDNKIK